MSSKKTKTVYICNSCQAEHPRWVGQCSECGEWNTISEVVKANITAPPTSAVSSAMKQYESYAGASTTSALPLSEIARLDTNKIMTGIKEFDRVLGNGITVGSTNVLSGDPGAGKTTLLSAVAGIMSNNMPTLYATAEESGSQFRDRSLDRLNINFNNTQFWLKCDGDVDKIIDEMIAKKIKFAIIDSINACYSNVFSGAPGSISQITGCAQKLNAIAKSHNITLIMVSHVTKDNSMAGPMKLSHIVDATFHLEMGEQQLRMLRSNKNRFGSTDVIGLFTMQEGGMRSVDNPSKIFLSTLLSPFPGSAITCVREGNRNLLLEIQSLVTETESEHAQRVALGIQLNRLKMIGAVLRKHLKIKLSHDIYISLVGGLRLDEKDTSADLATAVSLISSLEEKAISRQTCFLGEISLSGEIRPISGGVQRVKEAQKIGFTHFVIPKANYHSDMESEGCVVHSLHHISELKACLEHVYVPSAAAKKKTNKD